MHDFKWFRVSRAVVPVVASVLAIVAACDDANAPAKPDEWASAVVERMHIQNEVRLLAPDGKTFSSPVLQEGRGSEHPLPVVDLPPNSRSRELHVRFSHARSKDGETITNAFVHTGVKQPPRRVYGFKNGRVQYLFEPVYKRAGKSWVRESARVSLFNEAGQVIAQFDSRSVQGGALTNLHAAAPLSFAAESIAFDGLINDEVEGACWRELRDNLLAYGAWVAASYVATQAALKCPLTGPATEVACSAAAAAAMTALALFAKYMDTMDALTQCELRKWINETNSTGVPPVDRSTEKGAANDLMTVIADFMRQAIAAGTFWCNNDRSYCVYTGSQLM